jgi:hypothetical protein
MICIPCACCGNDIPEPSGKKRTDYLKCGCPMFPLICGSCRNMKQVIHTCSWCGKNGLARSTIPSQKASLLKAVAKRWETFRTDYPFLYLLSENWCNFVHYDKLMQGIQTFTKTIGLTD